MAQYIVVHTPLDAKIYAGDAFANFAKEIVSSFTKDLHCIATWAWGGGTNAICLWEAPSEQALIDFFADPARTVQVPVNGIYPATVTDWAEAKKQMGH